MITIHGKIPIRIHPTFWLLALFLAYLSSTTIAEGIVWILVVGISVLVHEYGHALTALFYHQRPVIDLVMTGGLTSYESRSLRGFKRFIVVLCGPLFGFGLYFLASLVLSLHVIHLPILHYFFVVLKFANLYWSFLNLIPVLPLDGGQLLRIILEGIWGEKGFKFSLLIGIVIAIGFGLYFLLSQSLIMFGFFFLFALQSYEMWKDVRFFSYSDSKKGFAKKLEEGELLIKNGRVEEAKKIFSDLRIHTKKGWIYAKATYHLATIAYHAGEIEEAYLFLLSIRKQLPSDSLALLQEVAFASKDYEIVAKISSSCYQASPTVEVALRNAKAFAALGKGRLAGGWLSSAVRKGKLNLANIMSEVLFDKVRNDPQFMEFFDEK